MKLNFRFKFCHALWLAIFLFSLLGTVQNAMAQWWKDTVWTKETDQSLLSNLKFSNNDSIIVGGGLFFDAKTGNEIWRISTNNEFFFLKDDKYFLKLNDDGKTFEIFDTKTYKVIDSLESDEIETIKFSSQTISSDYKYIAIKINNGFRIWNIETKRIEWTRIFPNETDLKEIMVNKILFNCENSKIYVRLWRKYHDPKKPDKPEYYTTKHQTIIYDLSTKDSIDVIDNNYIFLSNTCKYMIKGVGGDNGIEIYDFNTKEFLFSLPLNILTVSGLEFSPDDKYLVTASNNVDEGMKIWDIANKKLIYKYPMKNTYDNIDISHNGKFIVYSIGGFLGEFYANWDGTSVKIEYENSNIIYPNPTTGEINLNFHLKDAGHTLINITDTTGKTLRTIYDNYLNAGEQNIRLNVAWLTTGSYFIKISNPNTVITFNFIINR